MRLRTTQHVAWINAIWHVTLVMVKERTSSRMRLSSSDKSGCRPSRGTISYPSERSQTANSRFTQNLRYGMRILLNTLGS
jgi:hypothetical protein